jgi:hypothetical protein
MRRAVALIVSVAVVIPAAADVPFAIEPGGMFIRECDLPGERRRDDVVPRHAVCIQAARERWVVVYTTHGYRGVDDERSVIYQVRRDAPDGEVLKEGFLAQAVADWRPEGVPPAPEGKAYFKQHGHAVAFGVPKGAVIGGKPAPNGNLFVAQWRVLGRVLVPKEDRLEHARSSPELSAGTQDVEWVQFRLNGREDDIEIVQPADKLRQAGGWRLPAPMNQSFCPPVPFTDAADEWVGCNHFDRGRLAVLRFRFDPETGKYAWVQLSGFIEAGKRPLSEASMLRTRDGWLVSARSNGAVAWFKAADPFGEWPAPTFTPEPVLSAPHTTFRCADGVVRLFAGDSKASPQRYDRDPLYAWDVSHRDGVGVANRRVVFDSAEQKLTMRRVVRPRIDFAELFPPHGKVQIVAYSVTPRAYNFASEGTAIPAATDEDKAASGLYFSRLRYAADLPPAWQFE